MTFLQRMFGRSGRRRRLDPLYRAIVALARDPDWYRQGVPDSIDGRFDILAAITALALLRLEAEGESGREPAALLAELFVEDMDSSLRQIGIGDYVVGKHVGRLMGALGGRLGTLRAARGEGAPLDPFVRRNIFHDSPPSEQAVAAVAAKLERLAGEIDSAPLAEWLAGKLAAT